MSVCILHGIVFFALVQGIRVENFIPRKPPVIQQGVNLAQYVQKSEQTFPDFFVPELEERNLQSLARK